jgi:phosphatidate cytidylyltransferase
MGAVSGASAALTMRRSSLATRIGSAAILLPFTITVIWWSPWSVIATVIALIVLSLIELYGAFRHGGFQPLSILGIVIALALCAAIIAERLFGVHLIGAVAALGVMGSLIVALPAHDRKGLLVDWALTIGGALYMGALAAHIALIRLIDTPLNPSPLRDLGLAPGAGWLIFVGAVTWLQDALAYFAGKSYGRHPMTPTLSPKKTWEGAAGGLAGAIIGAILATLICGLPIPLWVAALLGIVGGIIGPLGDLAESLIKRQVGVKDAGHLIPGHGGMLDRIDSFLFTCPALYYLILLALGSQ